MILRRQSITAVPRAFHVAIVTALALTLPSFAWAAPGSPFGAGLPDGSMAGATSFTRLVGTLISWQLYFNQHITAAVRAIHHDGSAFWTLMALSFFYGIVHAAGPGHGKAVVSSYIVANRQTLRNGMILAFFASLAQALFAIILILVASVLLHLTSVSITNVTYKFEILSNMLVVLLGIWLVWSKILRPARSLKLDFVPVTALTQPRRFLSRRTQMGSVAFQMVDATVPAIGGAFWRIFERHVSRFGGSRAGARPSSRLRLWSRAYAGCQPSLRISGLAKSVDRCCINGFAPLHRRLDRAGILHFTEVDAGGNCSDVGHGVGSRDHGCHAGNSCRFRAADSGCADQRRQSVRAPHHSWRGSLRLDRGLAVRRPAIGWKSLYLARSSHRSMCESSHQDDRSDKQ
jgi:ABC-type nickel/cobalt efflux system permease component RcnA